MNEHEPKYKKGDVVFYWNNLANKVVEAKIEYTFTNWYTGHEFAGIEYVISTKDKPLVYGPDGVDFFHADKFEEEILFPSRYDCLVSEYEKETQEHERIKSELEDSEFKLETLKFYIDLE